MAAESDSLLISEVPTQASNVNIIPQLLNSLHNFFAKGGEKRRQGMLPMNARVQATMFGELDDEPMLDSDPLEHTQDTERQPTRQLVDLEVFASAKNPAKKQKPRGQGKGAMRFARNKIIACVLSVLCEPRPQQDTQITQEDKEKIESLVAKVSALFLNKIGFGDVSMNAACLKNHVSKLLDSGNKHSACSYILTSTGAVSVADEGASSGCCFLDGNFALRLKRSGRRTCLRSAALTSAVLSSESVNTLQVKANEYLSYVWSKVLPDVAFSTAALVAEVDNSGDSQVLGVYVV
jgi:hypothetical protein